MPLPHLYLVTAALRKLIEIQASAAYNSSIPNSVKTSGASPQDAPSGTDAVVNVYLFHLIENAHYKNQPPRKGSATSPIQLTPIGLDLHYVLTTRVPDAGTEDLRVEGEQRLLGIVAKIIHDFPNVTDDLFPAPILGAGNRFDLILRPVGIEESMNFWSADDVHLARPSLYVEARVIQLEPEEPQVFPGIVLTLGAFVLAGPGPRFVSSKSQLAFVPPDQPVRQLAAEPARVALFQDGQDPWVTAPDERAQELILQNNRVTLEGSGFGRGQRFLELQRVGAAVIRIALDVDQTAVNPEWEFDVRSNRITFRFFTSVTDAGAADVPVFPGIYTARLVLDEEPRSRVSNQIAFAVVPQIRAVNALGGDVFEIVLAGAFLTLAAHEFELIVGDERFEFVPLIDFDDEGEFTVFDASRIRFNRPTVSGDVFPLPINLSINSAPATPAWLEGP